MPRSRGSNVSSVTAPLRISHTRDGPVVVSLIQAVIAAENQAAAAALGQHAGHQRGHLLIGDAHRRRLGSPG